MYRFVKDYLNKKAGDKAYLSSRVAVDLLKKGIVEPVKAEDKKLEPPKVRPAKRKGK